MFLKIIAVMVLDACALSAAPASGGQVVESTPALWTEELRNTAQPVIVEFGVETCPECVVVRAATFDLARKYAGQVKFVRVYYGNGRRPTAPVVFPTIAYFAPDVQAQTGDGHTQVQVRKGLPVGASSGEIKRLLETWIRNKGKHS